MNAGSSKIKKDRLLHTTKI